MKKVLIPCIVLVSVLVIWLLSTSGEYYRTYSPDRQYSVYAKKYNWQNFVVRNPGGGSDASGKVVLYDEIRKEVIAQAPIVMIGNVGDIEWGEDKAYFVGDAYPSIVKPWKLPRPIKR